LGARQNLRADSFSRRAALQWPKAGSFKPFPYLPKNAATLLDNPQQTIIAELSAFERTYNYWFKQTFYPFYKIGQSIGQEVARVIGSAKEKRTFRAAPPAQDVAKELGSARRRGMTICAGAPERRDENGIRFLVSGYS
jgi:hypothetical protein